MISNEKWSVAAASRCGASHIRSETPCQDAYGSWCASFAGSSCQILAVSDGHGSDEYHHSHFGSFLAIRSAYEEFVEFFQWYSLLKTGPSDVEGVQPSGLERDFKAGFARKVVRRWRENVKAFQRDVMKLGITDEDSCEQQYRPFGCTLLAALVTKDRVFLFQLGDGGVFIRKNDGEIYPLIEDEDEPGEATDSLASRNPEKAAIVSAISLNDVSAVMLATDGLTKSFTRGQDEIVSKGVQHTIGWLVNRVTAEKLDVEGSVFDKFLDSCSVGGTGDDVTVAIAFSREKLLGDGPRQPGNTEQGRSETKPADTKCSEPAAGTEPQERTTEDPSERKGSEEQTIRKNEDTGKMSISKSTLETKTSENEATSGSASTEAGDVF
jgi:serine/threonine protein phosphatase PrpC